MLIVSGYLAALMAGIALAAVLSGFLSSAGAQTPQAGERGTLISTATHTFPVPPCPETADWAPDPPPSRISVFE